MVDPTGIRPGYGTGRHLQKGRLENYPRSKVNKVHMDRQGQRKLEADMENGTCETMLMDNKGKPIDQ